jgi:HD-GYP domain-containing protein (c-di-GMP phosphodiesterase class II)
MSAKSQKRYRVLLAEDEAELREIVAFYIEANFNADVVEVGSGDDAIAALKANPNFDIIICDYKMPNGTGGDVFLYLQKNKLPIPYVMFSSERPEYHPELTNIYDYIEKPIFNEPLKRVFQKLGEETSPSAIVNISPYARVRLKSIMVIHTVPCDLYLMLAEDKFIKVLNQGAIFDAEQYLRFQQKGVQYLYMAKQDSEGFLSTYLRDVLALIDDSDLDENDSVNVSEHMHSMISEMGYAMGFTPEVQELTKNSVNLALRVLRRNKKLSDLLAKIQLNQDNYINSHSVALAYLSAGLAVQMSWDSETTLFKLSLAAFLHDIVLRDEDTAIAHDLCPEKIKKSQEKDIEEHMQKAMLIAQAFSEIPPDVDIIIAQHHERADGSGYPLGLNHTRISPLSALFIVAHDVVAECIKANKPIDLAAFIMNNSAAYEFGYFKKVYLNMALHCAAKAQP